MVLPSVQRKSSDPPTKEQKESSCCHYCESRLVPDGGVVLSLLNWTVLSGKISLYPSPYPNNVAEDEHDQSDCGERCSNHGSPLPSQIANRINPTPRRASPIGFVASVRLRMTIVDCAQSLVVILISFDRPGDRQRELRSRQSSRRDSPLRRRGKMRRRRRRDCPGREPGS